MNCPTCNAPDSRVLEARIRADEAVRRRRECQACGNRWSTLERSYQRLPHPAKGKTVGPGSTKKSKLSDEQVLAIYHADLKRTTIGQLAQRFGVSKHTIYLIRAGKLHKKVIERSGLKLCTGCTHWRSAYCSMGFPDPELEGPAFAKDCNLYEASTQSISLDCPTSVQ